MRDAILRELGRGGQVYVLNNRVQTIDVVYTRLKKLVPEARIAVGHGQMREHALEDVMLDFYEGKFDVLLCTTIIEAGLDVPRANTLIVLDADRFGLAQLLSLIHISAPTSAARSWNCSAKRPARRCKRRTWSSPKVRAISRL